MKRLLLSLAVFSAFIALSFLQTAFGFGFTPIKTVLDVEPGKTYEVDFFVYDEKATEPKAFDVTFVPFEYDADGRKIYDEENSESHPFSAKDWVSLTDPVLKINPSESTRAETKIKVNVPEDAQQGTYKVAVYVLPTADSTVEGGAGVTLSYRIIGEMDFTIRGEGKEDLELEEFGLNQDAFEEGKIEFNTTVKNNSTLGSYPVGKILLYDENGNQVQNIIEHTDEVGGEIVTTGFESELLFNPEKAMVPPDTKKKIVSRLENPRLKVGKYTAKLEAYYGQEQKVLSGETEFELTSDIVIERFETDGFYSGLPVYFDVGISNHGTKPVNLTGEILINNIFGGLKDRIVIPAEHLTIDAAGSAVLPSESLVWNDAFAFGLYSATLNVNLGDVQGVLSSSTSFWVVNWGYAIIFVVVLALLIFVVIKGVKGYISLKNKVEKMEDKEKKE